MSSFGRSGTLAIVAVLTLTGCYSLVEPSFRPGDSRDVFNAISRRVTVTASLAGESACSDEELVDNAMRLTAKAADDEEPRDVYIYTFRTRGWDASEPIVDACQAEFAATHPDAVISRIDVPVWRVFGTDWSPELARELEAAFEEAHDAG